MKITPEPEMQSVLESARARAQRKAREAGFLGRVMRMSVAASVFTAWFMLALGWTRATVSFAIGAALSIGFLWSMRFAVTQVFTRSDLGRRRKWLALALAVGKYGLAGLIIWRFTRWPGANLPAFAAGAAITQAVLFLKALGLALAGDRTPRRWPDLTHMRE